MKKNMSILFIIILVAVGVAGIWFWGAKSRSKDDSIGFDPSAKQILFYGKECPHCKELETWIADNKIQDKFSFSEVEVWHSAAHANFFVEKAQECGFNKDQLGVPLFYSEGKCFSGTPDIEEFLKKQAGM